MFQRDFVASGRRPRASERNRFIYMSTRHPTGRQALPTRLHDHVKVSMFAARYLVANRGGS